MSYVVISVDYKGKPERVFGPFDSLDKANQFAAWNPSDLEVFDLETTAEELDRRARIEQERSGK